MYLVYVLRSRRLGFLYKGITNNLERRIQEHNQNLSIPTKGKGPWDLVFVQELETRKEARELEKFLKSGVGRELLKEISGR